jgi:heparin/heparan-sulfate lyase
MRHALPIVSYPERQDITREKGATILTAALVYDWCFPLLSAEDKTLFIKNMKRIAKTMEIGYPPTQQGAITGHAGEAQLMRDQLGGGIASYDEDPEMYNFAASRFFAEFVPARNFFYPSAWHHQGSMYGPYRFQWEILASWIFKRMVGQDVFDRAQGQIPYKWIYTTRTDTFPLLDGDGMAMRRLETKPFWPSMGDLLTASYYKDEVLWGITLARNSAKEGLSDKLYFFLFADPSIQAKAKPLASLPLSRYFDEPAGIMVARTGWAEGSKANTVVTEMKIAPWMFNNHKHLDAGHFQLWYKGLLAGDSGFYQGTLGGYGSAHDINYHKRTVAHNCVTVYDPDEKFYWGLDKNMTAVANDGGQHWPKGNGIDEKGTLEWFTNEDAGYHVGRVLAQAMGPDAQAPLFSYLSGELARAYGNKLERYIRSFVFLNLKDEAHPAALIVYDRLRSSQPSFKKTWLLHSPQEPQLSSEGFYTLGSWGGRLDATVLLPKAETARYEIIGGEGKEFWVDGKNYPQIAKSGSNGDYENAGYRIELSSKTEDKECRFLVTMQVHDAESASPLPVTSLTGPGYTGLRIADRIVIFPEAYENLKTVCFEVTKNATHCLIAGAPAGTWSLNLNGNRKERQVSQESQSLEFNAPVGTVEVSWVR